MSYRWERTNARPFHFSPSNLCSSAPTWFLWAMMNSFWRNYLSTIRALNYFQRHSRLLSRKNPVNLFQCNIPDLMPPLPHQRNAARLEAHESVATATAEFKPNSVANKDTELKPYNLISSPSPNQINIYICHCHHRIYHCNSRIWWRRCRQTNFAIIISIAMFYKVIFTRFRSL